MGFLEKYFHPDLTLNEDAAKEKADKALEGGKKVLGGVVGSVFDVASRLKKTLATPKRVADLSPEDREILDSMRAQRGISVNDPENNDQAS